MIKKIASLRSKRSNVFFSILAWFMLVLVFFAPATLSDKVIAPIDCIECIFRPLADRPIEEVHNQYIVDGASQYIPHKWALQKSWQEDGYIGWNPNSFGGTAMPENTMYSPGDWHNVLFAFLPFWEAWDWGIILQFFIAGCGMILLLNYSKIPIWYTLLGAISFAFYSQFITCLYYRWMGGIVWTPFLVWAILRYRHHLINIPAIIFMALVWRGGHLQSCTFSFLLVACIWGTDIWNHINQKDKLTEIGKSTLHYLLIGVLGAVLSLDVFVDTLPRMEGCKNLPMTWGFAQIPTIITSLFPNTLGVPQGIDIAKAFGATIFDCKFGGAIIFILALLGVFNNGAPKTAKVIFITSLLCTFTPLNTFLYSRSTVIMALGMAWLAVWQLNDLTKVSFSPIIWKRIAYIIGTTIGIWAILSCIIYIFHIPLAEKINAFISANISNFQQAGRIDWYHIRTERFLSKILIWDWQNLILTTGLMFGIYCCSKIKPNQKNTVWVTLVTLISFIELITFSYSWLSYSKIPESHYLYKTPSWMAELKSHVKSGTVLLYQPVGDSDFSCNNHLSSYGIRLAGGYETVQPKYIHPLKWESFDTDDYAKAGISHILYDTKWKEQAVPGWSLVMTTPQFKLYENPDFKGLFITDNGTSLQENWKTSNRLQITLPANTRKLDIRCSYHKGWQAYIKGEKLNITPTERWGMSVDIPLSTSPQELLLEFRMPYQKLYYTIMSLTALFLAFIAVRRKKR
ncbi:MAG: hypothetical protein II295_02960 [Akkermansia sp.]|nr:hypothetical protein [Akkermansia sp.]